MADANYWTRLNRQRISRRAALARLAVVAGSVGISGGLLAGCSTSRGTGTSTSGASGAGALGTPMQGGTFNAVFSNEAASIDPQKVSYPTDDAVASAAMSRPFRFKTGTRSGAHPNLIDDGEIEPDLGVSAETPDGISWTLKLRPNAKFQSIAPVNGHSVQAEDVKSTYVRALTFPTNPSRGALGMIDINQIQTPDNQTVVFKLNYPYAPFNKTLTSPVYSWIFPREALAGAYDPEKVMIGSGPFTFKSHTPDVEYVLTKNPDWFGTPVNIDTLHFAVITDPAARSAQFTSGHLDELLLQSPTDLETLKKSNPRAQLLPVSPTAGENIYLQLGDPTSPFADERVRQGMSMAIDRDTIHHAVFLDQFEDTHFVTASLGKWSLRLNQLDAEPATYYKYNLTQAKQILQSSGVLNQQYKWEYGNTLGAGAQDPQNGALFNMLTAAGFKMASVIVDYAKDYIDSGHGIRQGYFNKDVIVYGGQQPFTEVDEFLFSYFHSKSTQNEEKVNDPTLDAMINKERTLLNEDDRLKAVIDIQKYIARKVYIINPGEAKYFLFVNPRVKNYAVSTTMDGGVGTYAKLWLTQ
jgi:peptide/nickel transport system substrate-binding protein